MEKYIREIISQRYDNDFIKEKLYVIIPKIIEYFGEKYLNIIVDTIRNVDIYLCPFEQEMVRFINSKLNLKIDNYYNNYLNKDLVNSSNGISYSLTADIAYDKNTEEFINKGRDRKIIFLKDMSKYAYVNKENARLANEHLSKTLIHEFVHQIKSVLKNNIIRNDKRISRSGVQQSYSAINKKNNIISLSFLSESGRGFNEATCEYDTIEIFANIYGYEPQICAHPLEVNVLKGIIKKDGLIEDIHKYEINGDIPSLRNIFDTKFYDGAFDKIISLFDKMIRTSYKDNKETYDSLRNDSLKLLSSLNENESKVAKVA
ncbi:MAG: hypothetical protein ACI31M_00365 [Bacilli bacterium]